MLTSAKAKKFQDGDRLIRLYTTISLQLRSFLKNCHNFLSEGLTFFPAMGSKRSEMKHSPRLRGNRHGTDTHTHKPQCMYQTSKGYTCTECNVSHLYPS